MADQNTPSQALPIRVVLVDTSGNIIGSLPVTIADNGDYTLGSVNDAAVTGDNTGTVSAKLRGLDKILADIWDPINHVLKTTGGVGVGAVTIVDGSDVAEGSTIDAAWSGSGAGTVIAILKKIATGGGSAVTIADAADVAQGALADAAVVTDANGTLSGKLRGLVKWAFERMPTALGQATSAASFPVVLPAAQITTLTPPAAITGFALDATLTGRAARAQITDGTRDGTVKAASTLPVATDTAVVTTQRDAIPAGANVIGHVIIDSGSTTVVSGTSTVAGGKTNNNAAPGATNVGALPAVATAADQAWTEGNLVAASVDLAGFLRSKVSSWLGSTAPTVGQKAMTSSLPVVVASDQSAVPVSPPTLTKGTQGATGFSIQELKDAGRVNIMWTAEFAATAASEALLTLTESRDGAATTTFTSKVVTSGKRLRITSIAMSLESGGSTGTALQRGILRLRFNTAGAVATGSPLQGVWEVGFPVAPALKGVTAPITQEFPDGIEFLGDGTKQIGFTLINPDWVTTTMIPTTRVTIFAYEY